MSKNRLCDNKCKKFRISKSSDTGRYSSGQCHCQICDVWMDHNGCHLKDGSPALSNIDGWYCNCCNYQVRRNPRNLQYKTKLRASDTENHNFKLAGSIDLSYFNKQRATMIKNLAKIILEKNNHSKEIIHEYLFLENGFGIQNIEEEFNESINNIINLAQTINPPNKISMIVEFERTKSLLQRIPTKQDMENHSKLRISQYEKEFESWEHLLERLGYDPWYRENNTKYNLTHKKTTISSHSVNTNFEDLTHKNLEDLKNLIRNELKNEPNTLKLFNILDQNIIKYNKDYLEKILDQLD